jgi:DNA polymerase III epsilon subunit-like protein
MEKNICFIDLETTGLNLISDYPIEVGAILTDSSLNIIQEFHSYIKPNNKYKVDESSFSIHGIPNNIIDDAPSESSVTKCNV